MKPDTTATIHRIVSALEDKKGEDILVLDIRHLVSYTDFLVICSGTSSTHVNALMENVKKTFRDSGGPVYVNSSRDDSWWILDFVEVVVHVFRDVERVYYDLERLWGDAKRIRI